jgi:hypothetical protein
MHAAHVRFQGYQGRAAGGQAAQRGDTSPRSRPSPRSWRPCPLALWIAAWWALRAACQPLLLGTKWYDWVITAGFVALGAGHAWVWLS